MNMKKTLLLGLLLNISAHVCSAGSFDIPKSVYDEENRVIEESKKHIAKSEAQLNWLANFLLSDAEIAYVERRNMTTVDLAHYSEPPNKLPTPRPIGNPALNSKILFVLDAAKIRRIDKHGKDLRSYAGNATIGTYTMRSNLVHLTNKPPETMTCSNQDHSSSFRQCTAHLIGNWYLSFGWSSSTK